MPALITYHFFTGQINIAGWESTVGVQERITALIDQYEQIYLDAVLGAKFADVVRAGIASSSADFIKLRDGGLFSLKDGRTIRFAGIANSTTKYSPIADFVYYWFCRDNDTQSTYSGEAVQDADRAKAASASTKAMRAWNSSVESARQMWDILQYAVKEEGALIYTEFDPCQVNGSYLKPINLYGI